jgi:lipopolysaccharide/colanic/teichoic acid biosynthesis glycosyltransferase
MLVRIKLGSPVIFCQERPGKNEKIFKLYKFRTMTDARDENGELLPDEVRLTKFGKFLRSTSLDELPELWNILRGDMSIVGPRPLLVSYLPYYTEEERKRHCVSPGLTGLAQVNGRNNLTWEEKFAYDLEYVNRISFTADVKIIIKTALKVFIRADVQADTQTIEGNLAKIRQSLQTEKTENEHFDSKLRD